MKVSVCMITYNHEAYIEKAINSVLSQNTNFDYELIVSNDCSKDATDIIISQIIEKHPNNDKIKYICHKKNVGMMKNFISTLQEAKGEYIAICDGDDYWIDDNKLQMQVDFLEQNPNFNIVYTLNKILYNTGEIVENKIKPINQRITDVKDLVNDNFISASSVLYRNLISKTQFLPWIYSSPYGDWPTYLLLSKSGAKIKCLLHYTLVYRKNVGVMSKIQQNNVSIFQTSYNMFSQIFKDENYNDIKNIVEQKLYLLEISLIKLNNKNRDYRKAYVGMKNLKNYTIKNKIKTISILKIYFKSLTEGLLTKK